MTVNPDSDISTSFTRRSRRSGVGQMIDRIKPRCSLEVDGGIDVATAPLAVAAGADVLVAGSAIFNDSERVIAAMERLRAAIRLVVPR